MVRRFRSGVGAVLLVLTLMAMVSGTVLASGHIASDGQTLADQSQEVQDLYASVYGDDAAVQWAIEHDRELGFNRAAADDMAMGDITLTQEYQDVYAAALERSGDAELSHRIALDVLGRGSVAAFLEGSDPGVLYGIWVMAPPAPVVITRTVTVTVPAASPAPAAPAAQVGTGLFAGISQDNLDLVVWEAMAEETLPLANQLADIGGAMYTYEYEVAGLPVGLEYAREAVDSNSPVVITGTPRAKGSSDITYTVTETKTEGEDDEAETTTSTGELTFTITVGDKPPEDPALAFDAEIENRNYVAGIDQNVRISIPSASGGVGELTYVDIMIEAGTTGFMADDVNREVYASTPTPGMATVTYSVMDSADEATTVDGSFTITVAEDMIPTLMLPDADTVTWTVGIPVSTVLPEGNGGDGTLTYSVSGLPSGLSFDDGNRYISGTPSAIGEGETAATFVVTYTVTDENGSEVEVVFTATVSAAAA